MNVIVVAYACEPNESSEPGIGWNFSKIIANFDIVEEVVVFTRANNKKNINAVYKDENIKFVYYDLPPFFTYIKKKIPLGVSLYYLFWQFFVYFKIRALIKTKKFNLCHHLTFGVSKAHPPSYLINIPFLWGPIGGGDAIPLNFLLASNFKTIFNEILYYLAHKAAYLSPFGLLSRRRMKHIIFRTKSTFNNFPSAGCKTKSIMCETAIDIKHNIEVSRGSEFLDIVCIGRLMYGKGYILAIKGFYLFIKNGGKGVLSIYGKGPEELKLKQYVRKNNLENLVKFYGHVPSDIIHNKLLQANIMLHPSFREGGSWSIIEAMSYKVPVVCLDLSGPKDMVENNCGVKIPALNPAQVEIDIGLALMRLFKNRDLLNTLGENAYERVKDKYSWKNRESQMKAIYENFYNE